MSLTTLFMVGVDILATSLSAKLGTILAKTGDVVGGARDTSGNGGGTVDDVDVEWWQHVGFASRPKKPDPGQAACQGVTIRRGATDACVASRDVRGGQIYGNLDDGECSVYAPGAMGRALFKKDGSVTLYTTDDNTLTGNPVAFRISPTGGLEFTSQWGSMVLDQTGFHVKTQAGPRIDMGGISIPGIPSQVTGAFAGYAFMTAPTVQLQGANVVLGMGPVFNQGLGGNSALLIGGGPIPLSMADIMTSAVFASNTVWVST